MNRRSVNVAVHNCM